jgi:hypothetical protein
MAIVDPRLPAPATAPSLAKRPGSLGGRKVMLFDNGKLAAEYGPYRAIFDVVAPALRERHPDVTIVEHADDLLRGLIPRLEGVADDVRDQGVDAVVFALCDWGVSQPTAILAALLEARGIPTSIVAMEIGARQVLATAAHMAPGLPVTILRSLRSATYELVADETTGNLDAILGGLTAPVAELQQRFGRHDIEAPEPAATGGLIDLDGDDDSPVFTELMRKSRLGDGLPLVAPTESRVALMLEAAGIEPDAEIWPVVPPRPGPVTAREVAAVAVAAGCRPQWAPVVFGAYRAMAAPEFRLFQAAITTHPGGLLCLVSGPDAGRFGYASGRGALGPGFEANATTGRALALGPSFLLGAIPGGASLLAQGSPAQYSYCTAENLADSPWTGINADLGHPDKTTVTVLKCEGPHNVLDQQSVDPSALLTTIASTMATLGSNAAYVAGAETVLFLNPEHAAIIAGAGWSKHDVRSFLFDIARNPRDDLRGRGVGRMWPGWFDAADRVPVLPAVDDLYIAVCGGEGPASQVAIPWGYSRAVTAVVAT